MGPSGVTYAKNHTHTHTVRRILGSRRLYFYIVLLMVVVAILIAVRLVTQMRQSFGNFHYASDTDFELVTLPKQFAYPRGARCLDGSPPAFYYRAGATASEYWIIHLLPGAWCENEERCYQRSLTSLGSSSKAPTVITLNGIFSKDCKYNPQFCSWNVAVFLYCDGSSFLGNVTAPVKFKSKDLYLRGALIFDTILEYLLVETTLNRAEQIILTGSSAGGTAALIHADRLRSKLPKSVHSLHVVVDGSMFVNVPSIKGNYILGYLYRSVYNFHNIKDAESIQECTKTLPASEAWKCLLVSFYHSFVFTPVFFISSMFDLWQRENILRVPCFEKTCPDANIDTVYFSRDAVYRLAQEVTKSEKNSAFLTYCPSHTLLKKIQFYELTMGGLAMNDSLALWLLHSKSQELPKPISLREGMKTCGSYGHDWTIR